MVHAVSGSLNVNTFRNATWRVVTSAALRFLSPVQRGKKRTVLAG